MAGSAPRENQVATSPAEGKIYSSRHEHMVFMDEGLHRYTCSGCKQFGANIGFKYHSCLDFILHQACVVIPDEHVHPYFSQSPFQFRKSTHLPHHCDGCGENVGGFVFESRSAHLKLHPLCMDLPTTLRYSGHTDHVAMKLVTEKEGKYKCSKCSVTNSKWKYRCEANACKEKVDLNCAIADFHGLSEYGITRVSPHSRSYKVLEKLSTSGKSVAKVVAELAVSTVVGAVASVVGDELDEDRKS